MSTVPLDIKCHFIILICKWENHANLWKTTNWFQGLVNGGCTKLYHNDTKSHAFHLIFLYNDHFIIFVEYIN